MFCCYFVSVDYIVNLELCMALLQLLRIADNQAKTTICQQVGIAMQCICINGPQ